MPNKKPETGPGVYVLGPDKIENVGPIYGAIQSAGCDWRGHALSLNEALRQLELLKEHVDLVLVRADLARRGEEAALLEPLARWPLLVLLGGGRADRQAELARLPNVRAVLVVPPYDLSAISGLIGGQPVTADAPALSVNKPATPPPPTVAMPAASVPAQVNPPRSAVSLPTRVAVRPTISIRLAFYGARGGVGTTTAALETARLLAGQGRRVALFDVARRGDLHVLLGGEPVSQPVQHDLITVYGGEPTEDIAGDYEAIIIDGGRQRGTFNAQWVEVQRPLEENALRRLIDLPTVNQPGVARSPRRLGLSKIFSIEVTE